MIQIRLQHTLRHSLSMVPLLSKFILLLPFVLARHEVGKYNNLKNNLSKKIIKIKIKIKITYSMTEIN